MPNSSDFNRFAVNPTNIDISRSLFNMNHSVKFSCNVGEVIPFDVMEVLPGDTFTVDTSKVIRLQPLVAPIMDEVILDTYWFYVPNRLVWNHWINFMGENTESAWTPETEYSVPQIQYPDHGFEIGTIADYMGVPTNVDVTGTTNVETISALPFRAYALICDQWFRSEAVMDPVHVHVDDVTRVGVSSGNQVTDIELGGKPFIACKFFDYFTGALPSPQRGEPVSLPLLQPNRWGYHYFPVISPNSALAELPVHPYRAGQETTDPGIKFNLKYGQSGAIQEFGTDYDIYASSDGVHVNTISTDETKYPNSRLFASNLYAKFNDSLLNSVTVNDLRTAFAIQKYLEKSARFGGRYQEFIKGFFGVDSPDARLQRTEYLGGNRLSLNINSVEQTSATTSGTTPLGNVAGMSVTGDSNSDFTKSFTEHGYIIGCAVVRYHHSYQNGIHRGWLRKNKYEFYNPVFANLGEQAVKTDEIMFHAGGTFGYQERWAEYRYLPSRVAGELRSDASTPLDMWHLGDFYTTEPHLSPEWLREDKSNLDRCLAVTSDVANQVICDFYIETEASRPMPLYSIPGLIDHH